MKSNMKDYSTKYGSNATVESFSETQKGEVTLDGNLNNEVTVKNESDDYNVYGSKLKDINKIKELEEENRKLKEIIGDMVLKASKHLEEE